MTAFRRGWLILTLVFALLFVQDASAEAVGSIEVLASHEGILCALDETNTLYDRCDAGWVALETDLGNIQGIAWEDEICYLLLEDVVTIGSQTWYGLCLEAASLEGETLTVNAIHPLEAIDAELDGYLRVLDAVAQDGQVYLLIQNLADRFGDNYLWCVDAATGECRKLTTGQFQDLNLWRNSALLVQNDASNGGCALEAVDVKMGRSTTLLVLESLEDSAPAYDAENDTLYFLQDGLLMRWRGEGAPESCAVTGLQPKNSDVRRAVIWGKKYVLLEDGEVSYHPIDGEMPEQALLTVEGMTVETKLAELISGYSALHTDVRVERLWLPLNELSQRLITRDALPDIYHLYSSMGYADMARKGYFVDLSGLESVSALVDTMAPAVQELVKREDGTLVGLPVELKDSFTLAYNRKVLYSIGLTEDDLPRTLEELMAFIEEWGGRIKDYTDENNQTYALFDKLNDTYQILTYTLLNTQLATLTREGEALTLDSPALQQALEKLEALRDKLPAMELDSQYLGNFTLTLFPNAESAFMSGDREVYQPLFLSVDEEHDPVFPVRVRVMVINPYASAEQQEIAKSFLSYTAENLDDWEHIKLCPDFSTPKLRDDFAENWESAAEAVKNARADLEIAPEAQKRIFEERLEWAEANLAQVEADRYAVSPERIESIHTMSENFVPLLRTFEDTTAGSELLSRYITGDISTEEFVKQMERVLQMQQAEDE